MAEYKSGTIRRKSLQKYYLLTEAGKKSLGNYAHNWKKLTSTVQTHLKKK
jgi:DNA-binding PadR family transcriptional regulator